MSASDYVWLAFLIVGVLCGLAVAVDECVQAHNRSKAGEPEDWQP